MADDNEIARVPTAEGLDDRPMRVHVVMDNTTDSCRVMAHEDGVDPRGERPWSKGDIPMRVEWTAPRSRMTGEGQPLEVVVVVAKVFDGWTVEITYRVTADGTRRPTEVRLLADRAGEVIDSRVIRRLGLGAVDRQFEQWSRQMPMSLLIGTPNVRPGRAGSSDVKYAIWAKRYVDALAVDARRAVALVVEERTKAGDAGVTPAQVRGYLTKARRRGLLTAAPPGAAGGELTTKAKELLEDLREQMDSANMGGQ